MMVLATFTNIFYLYGWLNTASTPKGPNSWIFEYLHLKENI